jgi:hypothetical protein
MDGWMAATTTLIRMHNSQTRDQLEKTRQMETLQELAWVYVISLGVTRFFLLEHQGFSRMKVPYGF